MTRWMQLFTPTRATPTLAAMATGLALTAAASGQIMSADSPEVGDPLPDVTGFDADGSPFEMTRLEGKHAVIVFGCLT